MASQEPTLADTIRALRAASDASAGPHPEVDKLVDRYLGQLPFEEADEIEEHIVHCSSCAAQALAIVRWNGDDVAAARLVAQATSPQPLFPWWHELRPLRVAATVLLIATLASTAAWISTLVKVERLRSGEINVPVTTISMGYKRPVEPGSPELPVEVPPGAVLIFTPAEVPLQIPHEAQILRMDGQTVWTGRGLRPSPQGSFHLRLPRDLAPGTYRLRILPEKGQEIVLRVITQEPG